jgi:hypothetical protein
MPRSIAKDYTATRLWHGTAEFTAAPVPTDYPVTEDAVFREFSLTIEAPRRKLRHVA